MKRIVVKVGSNVLTRENGKINVSRLSAIVDQIVWLRQHDYEVILVSSGSIACGRGELKTSHQLDPVAQRQLFSAVGQVKLIGLYYSLFREHDVHIGQLLTMKESFATREEYLNQRACMNVMLNNDILPIINENDTVSITELMFTDNDELAGLVASMMNASVLVILTNVDGIFNGPPDDVHSRIIPTVYPGRDLSEYINDNKSDFGRGGMITKCTIARRVADEGIRVIIANGMTDDILIQLSEHPMDTLHTEFVPNPDGSTSVKKWIAHSESFSKGSVTVNAKAADALQGDTAASLLMVGVTAVDGDFAEGDIIDIMNEKGEVIALGRSVYSAEEAKKLIGKHEIKPIVHYDYLYIK